MSAICILFSTFNTKTYGLCEEASILKRILNFYHMPGPHPPGSEIPGSTTDISPGRLYPGMLRIQRGIGNTKTIEYYIRYFRTSNKYLLSPIKFLYFVTGAQRVTGTKQIHHLT